MSWWTPFLFSRLKPMWTSKPKEINKENRGKPLADTWFLREDMGDGITLIKEPFMDPAVGCNIWHIKGKERDLLFDSGSGLVSLKKHFPGLFEKPVICVSSHTHFDHIGGSYEFENRRMHKAEAHIIVTPTRENTTVEGYMDYKLFSALPFDGFDPDKYQVKAAPPTSLLKDSDIINLGDRSLEVLHLPGHSPGTIGLYDPECKILFSSDALYDGKLYDNVYHSDIPVFIDTMKRLLTLPVSCVHGGHYDSFNQKHMHALIHSYIQAKQTKSDNQSLIN